MDNKGKSAKDVQSNESLKGNAHKVREVVWYPSTAPHDREDGISPAKARS